MWVLIAPHITAIVRVRVSVTGTGLWLIAATEGISAHIHMDNSGISAVALLEPHTILLLRQIYSTTLSAEITCWPFGLT